MSAHEPAAPPALPPQLLQLWGEMYGLMRTQALYVAASLGLADVLAAGPRDADALAAATHCHAPSLRRVLRFLAVSGLLSVDADGRYALTALGAMLRTDAPLPGRAGATFYGSPFVWSAWGNLLATVRTGKPAFEVAHGAPLFAYLASDADAQRVFTDFMTEMARPRLGGAAAGYQFPESGLVVDVGGGTGTMLATVLQAHPGLNGVLLELPEVAEQAPGVLAAAGVAERCAVQSGSFLEGVPAGGDVYMLSNILHDWDDESCQRILGNCRRAMAVGSKLVIIDALMPEVDPPFRLAALDLQMMVVLGGKQRTAAELYALLAAASFRPLRALPQGLTEAEAG